MEKRLNFLLMGKTGHGKSATGNSILGRQDFKTSSCGESETKEVQHQYGNFENYRLKVLDVPGLKDTKLDNVTDVKETIKNINIALAICCEGVDAFLFVISFPIRFTEEEKSTLEALKHVFGEKYVSHVIVVVTRGDDFQGAMEEEKHPDVSFDEWCKKLKGELGKLYADCKGRFVLFNNREKNEEKKKEQRQQLFDLAEKLQTINGRYTSELFKAAGHERYVLELEAPQLKEEIQRKVNLLTADVNKFCEDRSAINREEIVKKIQDLKTEIKSPEKSHVSLADMLALVEEMERNLDNIDELHRLSDQLEKARQATEYWEKIGDRVQETGVKLAKSVALAPVGGLVYAGGVVGRSIHHKVNTNREKELEEKVEAARRKTNSVTRMSASGNRRQR